MKILALASGAVVNRATRGYDASKDSLTDILAKVVARAPKADKLEMRDGDKVVKTFLVKDGVAVEKVKAARAPKALAAVDADGNPIKRPRGRPPLLDADGNRIRKVYVRRNPEHGKATGVIRDLMLSGEGFTREAALAKLVEAMPGKDIVSLANILGVAMLNVAKKENLVKHTAKVEGSRRKVFTFTKAVADEAPASDEAIAA